DGKIDPNEVEFPNLGDPSGAPGRIKVVSMGFLVDDAETALMWRGLILARALEQFLTDVRWGEMDYPLLDMPPVTGHVQMAQARRSRSPPRPAPPAPSSTASRHGSSTSCSRRSTSARARRASSISPRPTSTRRTPPRGRTQL